MHVICVKPGKYHKKLAWQYFINGGSRLTLYNPANSQETSPTLVILLLRDRNHVISVFLKVRNFGVPQPSTIERREDVGNL